MVKSLSAMTKNILICWEHDALTDIVHALGETSYAMAVERHC